MKLVETFLGDGEIIALLHMGEAMSWLGYHLYFLGRRAAEN